jgi:DNA gyrase subunit A
VPEAGRASQGRPIVNLFELGPEERVQGLLALSSLDVDDLAIVTFTERGLVKRTEISQYANIRAGGIIALGLEEGDRLIAVHLAGLEDELFMATRDGQAIRFKSSDARLMGRPARGVRGIGLREGDRVVSAVVLREEPSILTVTSGGYGKRTVVEDYRGQGRGGLGLINLKATERTGKVVAALKVEDDDEIIVATRLGKLIRTPVGAISTLGRNTQGVRVIKLGSDDEVVSVVRAGKVQDEDEPEGLDSQDQDGESSDA